MYSQTPNNSSGRILCALGVVGERQEESKKSADAAGLTSSDFSSTSVNCLKYVVGV